VLMPLIHILLIVPTCKSLDNMINIVKVILGPAFIGMYTVSYSELFLIFRRIYLLLKIDDAVWCSIATRRSHIALSMEACTERHWHRPSSTSGRFLMTVGAQSIWSVPYRYTTSEPKVNQSHGTGCYPLVEHFTCNHVPSDRFCLIYQYRGYNTRLLNLRHVLGCPNTWTICRWIYDIYVAMVSSSHFSLTPELSRTICRQLGASVTPTHINLSIT